MYLNTCVIFWATKSIAEKKKKGIHVNMRQWEEPHPFLCPALAALTLSIYHLKVEVSVSISIGKVSYNSKRTCSTGKWLAEKACLQDIKLPLLQSAKKVGQWELVVLINQLVGSLANSRTHCHPSSSCPKKHCWPVPFPIEFICHWRENRFSICYSAVALPFISILSPFFHSACVIVFKWIEAN